MRRHWMKAHGGWKRLAADEGMSLVEVLFAMTILLIVMTGFTVSMTSALKLNHTNRNRVIAANVASQEMSALRAMDFEDIPHGHVERGVAVGQTTFQVAQDAEMVMLDAADNACDSPTAVGEQPAYLHVTLTVSWPSPGDVQPVRNETVINPPVSAYDPYAGHIAVKVTDRDARPGLGHVVNVRNIVTGQLWSSAVSVDGCAFFANLDPDEYHVWLDTVGHVDRATGLQNTLDKQPEPDRFTVASATTTAIEFNYDEAAVLDLHLVGAQGGPVPDGIPVTVANPGVSVLGTKVFAALPADPLFPFGSGYAAWAGQCPDADPEYVIEVTGERAYPDAVRQTFASEPGQTTHGNLTMATAQLRVENSAGSPVPGAVILARPSCDDGSGDPLDATTSSGTAKPVALPYGQWRFWVQGQDEATQSVTATLAPGAGTPTEVVVPSGS